MSPDNVSCPLAGGQKHLQWRTTDLVEGGPFQNEGDEAVTARVSAGIRSG